MSSIIMSETRVYKNEYALPWLNKGVLDLLLDMDKKYWRVFEWGSGFSTLWWQDTVKEIVSVEHSKKFFKIICKEGVKKNCKYMRRDLIKNKDCPYIQAIHEIGGKFDCIVVDGRNRVLCIKQIPGHIKRNGIIILDNSNRDRYKEGIDLLNSLYTIHYTSPVIKDDPPRSWKTTVWKN